MLTRTSGVFAIMFPFIFGFASIRAEELPAGVNPPANVMQYKRQAGGTGNTPSTPTPTPSTPVPPQSSTTQPNPPPASSTSPTSPNSPTSSDAPNTPTTQNTQTTQTTNNNPPPSSTSVETTIPVTTTNNDGSTVTSQLTTRTLAPVSDSVVQTETGSKNSVVKVGSKTIDPATLSKKTTVRQPLVAQETQHLTRTSIWTDANGNVHSSVYTTENVFASTTGYATATIAPSLANDGGNGSNLSSHTKSIIGGVVGGIGGAVLIGGLAFVAWRLWGKKKQEHDMDDYSYSPHDSINAQKRYSQNTLSTEAYNNPSGRYNTASNF